MKKTKKYEKPEMKAYDMESTPLMLLASDTTATGEKGNMYGVDE